MSYLNPVTNQEQDTNPETGLTDWEMEQRYISMLDDTYGVVTVAGYQYETSRLLKEVDPVAYRVGLADYESFIQSY